jgi:hypothetical protein
VTPQRADQHCAFMAVLVDIETGVYAVEPALLSRVRRVLKLEEGVTSAPPVLVSEFAEEVAAERE